MVACKVADDAMLTVAWQVLGSSCRLSLLQVNCTLFSTLPCLPMQAAALQALLQQCAADLEAQQAAAAQLDGSLQAAAAEADAAQQEAAALRLSLRLTAAEQQAVQAELQASVQWPP